MTAPDSSTRVGPASSPPPETGGYAPGTILADRYRIVALLGRGGMGEVYRADDLKLGQTVALKFLPSRIERDADARARLLAETRNARSIAHPNVCRVYDVGDIGARPFLTMEYIDGEDLASLLRRIGRLPAAKAVEIAQQLCAGLAAAHDRGVLHRDLKPANVMLDGRGQARITDFGLAIEKHDREAGGDFAGTVAYMAPERLHGAPATVQSDIYALGLILYETCTGKPPFKAQTFEEWRLAHDSSTPTPPTELSGDVDPIVERVILRCLEKDPAKRPASAAHVAAALPGGDPLAAAIAAGETPSPELVAASGEEGTLPRRTAWLWLGACALGLAIAAGANQWTSLENLVPFDGGPEVLQAKARAVLMSLGYTQAARDHQWWFAISTSRWRALAARPSAEQRFEAARRMTPTPIVFAYRQSPADLRPRDPEGVISASDPAPQVEGEALVGLDTLGRLTWLRVVPSRREPDPPDSREPDWRPVLAAAGLSNTSLTPDRPRVVPPVAFDGRQAWTGTLGGEAFRFEAAAFRGRIVYAEWGVGASGPDVSDAPRAPLASYVAAAVSTVQLLALVLIVLLARHNVKMGRGDRRGARRVAVFCLVVGLVGHLIGWHWVPDVSWLWDAIRSTLGGTLFNAAWVWIAYLALEPFARRAWPHLLVGWSRLIDARWRDPLVGQALLVGVVFGTLVATLGRLPGFGGRLFGLAATTPFYFLGAVDPFNIYLRGLLEGIRTGTVLALGLVALLVLWRFALRADRAVFAATAIVGALFSIHAAGPIVLDVAQALATGIACVLLVRRFGLLALVVGVAVNVVVRFTPWTVDLAKWFAWRPMLSVILIMGLALWGFRNVLGRQAAFPKLQLD